MAAEDDPLARVRARIDALDREIQQLISERAACAKEVAHIKGRGGDVVYYRPEREAQVLRSVMERNSGEMPAAHMVRIFREIMSACLALEQPLTVAFLGPAGTYTQEAAIKHFGHAVTLVSQATVEEVFREVETGRSDYGVVAVENSTEGSVTHTLDLLINSPLQISGEVELRIHHHLLSRATKLDDVTVVYAHQQALAQCRGWLDGHLRGVKQVAVNSNAEAAKRAVTELTSAAIASDAAGEIYGHNVLASNIEDVSGNTTRFFVIGASYPPASGRDRTSLLVMTGNQPGALYRVLSPLAHHGISMTRIESRPSRRGVWDYLFFVDIEGHVEETAVAAALQELRAAADDVKLLGSYPVVVV